MAGRKVISIRVSEAVQLYCRDLANTGRAENTVRSARDTLRVLEMVTKNKVVRNIDKKDITAYFDNRVAAGIQQSTLNLYTTRLRLFFRWCEEESYIDPTARPMRGREAVKLIPKQRARLVQEDFGPLMDTTDNPRDRVVLALGVYTMMRASEVRTLRLGDVSLEAGTIEVVRWKTRRRDTLPISAELHDELASYFVWYSTFPNRRLADGSAPTTGLEPQWLLAPGNKLRQAAYSPVTGRLEPLPVSQMVLTPEKQMWHNGYAVIVQKALKKLGWNVQPGEGMHTLRRSGARELFDQLRDRTGFDDAMMTVMSMLGHAKPETTLIYLGLEKEAERRNSVIKHNIMFPRAARTNGNVTPLRAVGNDG